MKKYKKILTILLSVLLVTSLFCGCAKTEVAQTSAQTEAQNETKSDEPKAITNETVKEDKFVCGALSQAATTEEEENVELSNFNRNYSVKFYENLSSMMLALRSGKIDCATLLPKSTAMYIKERNNDIVINNDQDMQKLIYSMAVLESNKEVYNIFNDKVNELINDGTIKELESKYIDDFIKNKEDPKVVEMPQFDGAKTIKVAVTGDLPPFDFVSADGKPSGYNAALLSEIANRAKVNIELVAIDEVAKVTALVTGNVDVLFWLTGFALDERNTFYDCPKGVILTDCYYEDDSYRISLKGGMFDTNN